MMKEAEVGKFVKRKILIFTVSSAASGCDSKKVQKKNAFRLIVLSQ
jgi:hypothetical protein